MDIKKFAFWSTVITIPSSLLYLILGYYFGAAYDRIDRYLHIGGYALGAGVVVVGVVIYLQRKYSERFFKDLEQ
jgi:membrane protein DedA with SNARE-associated domain